MSQERDESRRRPRYLIEETTEGTKQTNVSIGQLTKLAAELRSSVAGFKV